MEPHPDYAPSTSIQRYEIKNSINIMKNIWYHTRSYIILIRYVLSNFIPIN